MVDLCSGIPLWNTSLTWDNEQPELTPCFQDIFLILLPCVWFWLALPPALCYLYTSPQQNLPLKHSALSIVKLAVCLVLFLMEVLQLVDGAVNHTTDFFPIIFYIGRSTQALTFLMVAIFARVLMWRGVITSGIIHIFWGMRCFADCVILYTVIIKKIYLTSPFQMYVFLISLVITSLQLILNCFAEKRNLKGENKKECPELRSSFSSKVLFWWSTKLIVLGFRKPLDEQDVWDLNPRDTCNTVLPKFEANWKDELKGYYPPKIYPSSTITCSIAEKVPLLAGGRVVNAGYRVVNAGGRVVNADQKPSLILTLLRTFYPALIKSYCCKAASDALQFISPLLLSALIDHVQLEHMDYVWKGYVLAVGIFLVNIIQACFYQQMFNYAFTLAMRVKTTLIASIYKKALVLNKESQQSSTVGGTVSLVAVDCQRIQDMITYTWLLWSLPFQMCLGAYILYMRMGPAVFVGLSVLLLLFPANVFFAYKQQQLQRLNLIEKDKRLKLINEVLAGIKVLKLYAWEPAFMERIRHIRSEEIKILMRTAYLNAFSIFIWTVAPYVVTLATFSAFVLVSGIHLDSCSAFVTLSVFNILQYPLKFIPETVILMTQSAVSFQRIRRFLTLPEIDHNLVGTIPSTGTDSAIVINRGTCKWEQDGKDILVNIDLHVSQGEVVAVVGQVGAGKSSLIAAILGEMEFVTGSISRMGKVAYVAQEAWIQNATIRDNILFGRSFNHKWYKQVLEACSLNNDLTMLPAGDLTEIGEKGTNLSGGQKQRVSLARAVYSDADIYLLDDPLSAVDSHVGKHIFKKVIGNKGLLNHKTRVFVTHSVHWLPMMDKVVVLDEGRVHESGPYEDLITHDGPFTQYLKDYFTTGDSENNTPSDEDSEVRDMKRNIYDRVELVTSTSSGDEDVAVLRKGRKKRMRAFTDSGGYLNSASYEALETGKLIETEKPETGQVKYSVFWRYIQAVGVCSTILIVLLFALYQTASVLANVVVSKWSDAVFFSNATSNVTIEDGVVHTSSNVTMSLDTSYLIVYGISGLVQGIFILLYAYLICIRLVTAAKNLHSAMLDKILRSPMSFFDTNPLGRIVNRFSRDVDIIDNELPRILFTYISTMFSVFSIIIVISVNTPLLLTAAIPLAMFYYTIQRIFVPCSRQLKRLLATSRSPMLSHFSESISGASTIRAYGATDRFIDEITKRVDTNQIFYFAAMVVNRWLGIWMEFLGNCIVLAASVFSLITPGITGGAIGLSITYALQITQSLKWLVRMLSDLETNIVSVERVKEYSELPTEADWINPYTRPRLTWPQKGVLEFLNYSTCYRPGLPLVLKKVTCQIQAGEKIGIVGRTGAGKSSLTMALFRLVEAVGGGITLDGVVLEKLGLHDLRSRISILPQDPVMLSGSLRMNLDPTDRFSDGDIWSALEHAHLKQHVSELPGGLNQECGEGGLSFSLGQRQLVCLARALLRKTKLLVLDEATAAVDLETDNLIQETIRREFSNCTILTIAHRINTIMDYDRILVMEDGRISEFNKPQNLLSNKQSLFYSLAKDAKLV